MASTASLENEPGASAVSMRDRLVPPVAALAAAAPGNLIDTASLAAGPHISAAAADAGWLQDTPCLAAWLLLQLHWLGSTRLRVDLQTDAGPARLGHFQLDVSRPARAWLVEIDSARRQLMQAEQQAHQPDHTHHVHGEPSANTAAETSEPADISLWLAASSTLTAGLPPGTLLALGLSIPPRAPHPFTETAAAPPAETTTLHARFDPTLISEEQVATLLRATLQVASELLRSPDAALRDIGLLSADERALLSSWQGPAAARPASWSVHGMFAHQARERGDAVALAWQGGSLVYAELALQAGALADVLQQAGVRPGATVAVALDRSPRAIIALLAILKAGAAYLPLDPAYPTQRLHFMLDDAGADCILTTRDHQGRFDVGSKATTAAKADTLGLAPRAPPLVLVDDWPRAGLPAASAGRLHHDSPGDAESPAYVMYTSGSTGTPKGITIPHRAILRLVLEPAWVALSAGDAVLHAAPLGFDASTFEIWGPLLNGGRCVLHDEALPTGPGLARVIERESVDTAWLTAALFNAVIDDNPLHLRGLRQLLTGGEALSVPHVRRALAALPGTTLINGYGPTECTTFTATHRIPASLPAGLRSIPIGRPINGTTAHVLGPTLQALPPGLVGELWVGGPGLALGYLHRPELTAQHFIADPFEPPSPSQTQAHAGGAPARLYRTGDLVRWLPDGTLEFIGRADSQVKVRGFRIELGDIESALASHPGVSACAVAAVAAPNAAHGDTRLVAYVVARDGPVPAAALRSHLAARLPEFMLPTHTVWLPALPITANGKLDRRALPAPPATRPETGLPWLAPQGEVEALLCEVFAEVLGLDRVGRLDNFFELGGNSLGVLRALARLASRGTELATTDFFRQPTPQGLAQALSPRDGGGHVAPAAPRPLATPTADATAHHHDAIAIIAMAGRFPGAQDVETLWRNLCAGREGITFFEPEQLDPSLPASLRNDPAYVAARGVLDEVGMFDAAFFGISPKEAALMDPQQRIFLELCWECLERGGYAPDQTPVPVGVFAGMYNASYFQHHLAGRSELIDAVGEFPVMLANEKDYIATRVAHRLNLTGPAISLNTACSTSLVAVVQAMGSLRLGQCDMALAGGASITCPPRSGYLYQEGAMLSPDGHTRSFAADGQGTVFSDGAGVLLLKRLADALADGDPLYAVLRGGAVNNDGRAKASFTAPSVDGQAAVVTAALRDAGVDARSISYLEAHGTATPMGDPVEIAALTQAYRADTADSGFCAIGSVKSNLGHLVVAAGAAGLIKTALSLSHEQRPPSLHHDGSASRIDFASTPFVVQHRLSSWPRGPVVRRAGVSAFGVGGTNAHVIVEEAPEVTEHEPGRGPQLLQLSARSAAALQASTQRLADFLAAEPGLDLADVAHTLRVGRSAFAHRATVVAESPAEAAERLRSPESAWVTTQVTGPREPEVIFMFPGQGAHYAGMGRGLYESEPVFRAAVDECLAALADGKAALGAGASHTGALLRASLMGDDAPSLDATSLAQPALFMLGYGLACSWRALGVTPVALIGHSVGEFVAAAVAGVLPVADAMRLVAQRGRLMQALPEGAMRSVGQAAAQLAGRLPAGLSVAAENSPTNCVVAGPGDAVAVFAAVLETEGIASRPLRTSHAFHSAMMDPVLAPFEAALQNASPGMPSGPLQPPRLPIVSTLTGGLLQAGEATDPRYWARHLRETVRFSAALQEARRLFPGAVLLEVGPRQTLTSLARQHRSAQQPPPVGFASLADAPELEAAALRRAAGRLWAMGAPVATARFDTRQRARRLRLPTTPFERKLHWIDALPHAETQTAPTGPPATLQSPYPPYPPLGVPPPDSPVAAALDSQSVPTPAAEAPAPAAARVVPPEPLMSADLTLPAGARRQELIAQLRSLVDDFAGVELAPADSGLSFVEQGLDSLQLTQFALQIKRRFKLDVSFRQLMEGLRTLDGLARHLDERLPAPSAVAAGLAHEIPFAPAGAAVQPTGALPSGAVMPAATSAAPGAPHEFMQQVIQQQMVLMAQQLALLGGHAAGQAVSAELAAAGDHPRAPQAASPAPSPDAPVSAPASDSASAGMVSYDVKTAFGAIARIHRSGAEPVTERQQQRLDAFMRRYTARSAKSKAYTQAHRAHLADPRVVNGFRPQLKEITYQLVIERSKGSRVWDLDGNEYIDVLNGFGMNMFGWSPDFVQDAVRKQLDLGYEIGPQHPLAGLVAQQVCELTGFDRAGLCNTGSEAVMGALRIARTVTGRSLVVIFTGSYHGIFDEVIVRGTRSLRSVPAAPGILPNTSENVLVLDYGSDDALRIIEERMDDIAAVLVEPVQSRRPDLQPREFLHRLRELTAAGGALYIFDEVVTGFRVHPRGAQGHFGIEADLACYGKVVGGGFPIGVIAGKRAFMDALDGGGWQFGDDSGPTVGVTYFAGTFVRHPLALAAAHAVLKHLKASGPGLQQALTETTTGLAAQLNHFCEEVGAPLVIKHFGSVWKTFFNEEHPLQDLLFAMMRSRGIHILDNFPCFMTTAHSPTDVQAVVAAFKESVLELQEADLLPRRKAPRAAVLDASQPPVAGARLGKDPEGRSAWYVPHPDNPKKFVKVDA